MPSTIIVTCAGCGRRYKGVPGSSKYRCAVCNNALTFPRMPRAAVPGKTLCSNCWKGVDASTVPTVCPACKQGIGTREGGRATPPGLFTNAADPVPIDAEDEQLSCTARDLEARIVAAQVAAKLGDRGPPPASNETPQAGGKPQPAEAKHQEAASGEGAGTPESRNEPLAQYDKERKTDDPWRMTPDEAIAASTNRPPRIASEGASASGSLHEAIAWYADAPKAPDQPPVTSDDATASLGAASSQSLPAVSTREEALALAEQLQAEKAELHRELDHFREAAIQALEPLGEEYSRRMQDMLAESDRLHASIEQARQDVNRRLEEAESAVRELRSQLAAAAQEMNERLAQVIGTAPHKPEVVAVPAFANSGPFVELLAAGIPPGTVVTVSRHTPGDGQTKSPAA